MNTVKKKFKIYGKKYFFVVDNGKNLIEIFEGKMTSHKYYIINNQLCASTDKKDCVEAVFVSKDEIIFPQGKTHMKRIKE